MAERYKTDSLGIAFFRAECYLLCSTRVGHSGLHFSKYWLITVAEHMSPIGHKFLLILGYGTL